MAIRSPDPVSDAAAYQRHLLSLLGDDDPADVQSGTRARLTAVIEESDQDLRRKPDAVEWSVLELLGHFADAEIVMSGRYRWALSQDRPPLLGYDQDLWVQRLKHNQDEPAELLELFGALRGVNLRLWTRSSAEERARVALHAERGPESYELMFRMIAGHDRFHLEQMQATLRQVRAG
jgi:DinB superfamily